MATYQVSFNLLTKTALVQASGAAVPGGSVNIGTFSHPDPIYPGSVVIFHAVRDLLYHRKASDASAGGKYPNNITDMASIDIVLADGLAAPVVPNLPA